MSFTKDVIKWLQKVERRCNSTIRNTARETSQRTVDRTGVSSGKLMGRWQPSIGTPQTNNYEGGESAWYKDPSSPTGWSKDESIAAQNESAAKAFIEPQIAAVTSALEFTDTFYLTNDTEYGPQAEYQGWTTVGPYRMKGRTAAEFEMIVLEAVRQAKLENP